MKDLPLTWRQFLQILVTGITSTGDKTDAAGEQALKVLERTDSSDKDPWKTVLDALGKIKGYNLSGIRGLRNLVGDETTLDEDLSQQSPEKRLFFLIEHSHGEMIMENGTFSDYAALHEQGIVHVWLDTPRPAAGSIKSCWSSPRHPAPVVSRTWLGRVISGLLSGGRAEKALPTAPHESVAPVLESRTQLPGFPLSIWTDGEASQPPKKRDFADRLMGVTSVLWKQPRTATLIAADDEQGRPCRMVVIKRIFLRNCLLFQDAKQTQVSELYRKKVQDFSQQSLPGLLARNRLFRSLFYVEEVQDWKALLEGLVPPQGKTASVSQRRLGDELPDNFRKWLGSLDAKHLDEANRYRIVSEINDSLNRPDLHDAKGWPRQNMSPEEQSLLDKGPTQRTVVETYRFNRLLIEAAFPGVFRSIREFRPRVAGDFELAVQQISQHSPQVPLPLRPREGDLIFENGAPADALYLILEGRVRLNLGNSEKRIPFNHLVENGFFGESCIEEGADPRYLYQAEAITNCTLMKIDRSAVLALAQQFPDLKNKLLWETNRMKRRAEQVLQGHRLPPAELSPQTAAKLMRATNLLVIDMNRCTRCDQCVHACTASHQGQPRFHRANPDLRIGQWEIARACVHCSDAPCLEACPVGAITLLDNGSVQVLRDRCISCRKCERDCPFGVIEYHPPIDAADGASADKKDYVVTHKCDLCLTPERDPPCVVACPYDAAKRGSPSEFFPGLKSMARFTEPE